MKTFITISLSLLAGVCLGLVLSGPPKIEVREVVKETDPSKEQLESAYNTGVVFGAIAVRNGADVFDVPKLIEKAREENRKFRAQMDADEAKIQEASK